MPKKCGIATFTNNLLLNLQDIGLKAELFVIAAESRENHKYGREVKAVIDTANHASYKKAASLLKRQRPDITLLQHEYGLYGGAWTDSTVSEPWHHYPTGSYLAELIESLPCPIITTLHTVLNNLDPRREEILGRIIKRSDRVVVMSQQSKKTILGQFPAVKNKLVMIPHGVMVTKKPAKKSVILKRLNLNDGRFYLGVSGLITPNKKIETIIAALPKIITKYPQVHLLVVGQTHPQILKDSGDVYRRRLKKMIRQLGVDEHVSFVNKYMPADKLLDYLAVIDIYLTIHSDPEQAASGTLANAVGNGLVTISTPYAYARELLANQRGVLVPFDNPAAISQAINRLIADKALYRRIQGNASSYGQHMSWSRVAQAYWDLMEAVINERQAVY